MADTDSLAEAQPEAEESDEKSPRAASSKATRRVVRRGWRLIEINEAPAMETR